MREIFVSEPQVDWTSPVGGGLRLEVSTTLDGVVHPLVSVLARDEDESLWVQVEAGDKLVAFPAKLMQQLLSEAVGQVHSEAWHDRPGPAGQDA
jgi:hypothetical protein